MKYRLQKIIARAGIASRRVAEEMILQGRVQVNGTTVTRLGSTADPQRDLIEVDGIPLKRQHHHNIYIMLHKPAGCITTVHDPEGRPTVMQFLKGIDERLFPVGRLDYDTEGLLILTNDGDFANILMHPRYGFRRTYAVKVQGTVSPQNLIRLQKGIMIDGVKMSFQKIGFLKKSLKNTWYEIILHEGKNRQIKKMFETIGHRTLRIIRTGFGPFRLGDLPSGAWRKLTEHEVHEVKSIARRSENHNSRVI